MAVVPVAPSPPVEHRDQQADEEQSADVSFTHLEEFNMGETTGLAALKRLRTVEEQAMWDRYDTGDAAEFHAGISRYTSDEIERKRLQQEMSEFAHWNAETMGQEIGGTDLDNSEDFGVDEISSSGDEPVDNDNPDQREWSPYGSKMVRQCSWEFISKCD